jgi:transposase
MAYKLQRTRNRHFDESVRREVVKKIENNVLSVTQASREYSVSATSIYKWMYQYSLYLKKGIRIIVEKKSQTEKVKALQQRIEELERAVGQKQMEVDILNKMLEFGSDHVGYDIKKKFGGKQSSGSKTIRNNTGTKSK